MLRRRCSNVVTTSDSDVITTSETYVASTLILGRATTLWQRQPWRFDNVVTKSLCQLVTQRFLSKAVSGFKNKCKHEISNFWNNRFIIYLFQGYKAIRRLRNIMRAKTTWDVSEDTCSLSKHFLSLHFPSLSIIISLCWVNKLLTNKNFHSQETQTWHFKVRILFIKRCYSKF